MEIIWPLIEGLGTLTCSGNSSCNGVNFPDNPTSTEALVINCDSLRECSNAYMYCPKDDQCTINCLSKESCMQARIYCAEGQDCTVNCGGSESCSSLQLYCLSNNQCTINCNYQDACTYLRPMSYISSPGSVNVVCNTPTACPTGYLDNADTWSYDPTSSPSISPIAVPTIAPTPAPTNIPTLSPTYCLEGNIFTNDGANEKNITKSIKELQFEILDDIGPYMLTTRFAQLSLGPQSMTNDDSFPVLFVDVISTFNPSHAFAYLQIICISLH